MDNSNPFITYLQVKIGGGGGGGGDIPGEHHSSCLIAILSQDLDILDQDLVKIAVGL